MLLMSSMLLAMSNIHVIDVFYVSWSEHHRCYAFGLCDLELVVLMIDLR